MTKPDVPPMWKQVFGMADRALKLCSIPLDNADLRRHSIQKCFDWILEHAGQDGIAATDGLGAIFPPMVYIQIVYKAMGIDRQDPLVKRAERELDEFFIEEDDNIRIQPCFSPVWDSGIALYALNDCGHDQHDEPAARTAQWLRSKECTFQGDWLNNLTRPTRNGSWYFEYNNSWYPDCDDTAMVAMALKRTGGVANEQAAQRGVEWLLAMQNDDGGWAAFDKTKDRPILDCVPFADHNAMQDPSCPDITGRVLECLSWNGFDIKHTSVQRAITYIRSKQEPEGCFFGRWGVNYIYGTWQSVVGPIRCGEQVSNLWLQKAGAWMKSIQQEDGSFGESANSYEDPALKGQGPSTASQTAWAAMVLQEIYGPDDVCLLQALRWLCRTQLDHDDAQDPLRNPDGDPAGSWRETEFTGTGFPRVFYLRYHLYRLYFPLMAIGRFLAAHEAQDPSGGHQDIPATAASMG